MALPLAIQSINGILNYSTQRQLPNAVYMVLLCVAIAVGVGSIAYLPISRGYKMIAVVAYVPIAAFILIMYGLFFAGYMFGDWL